MREHKTEGDTDRQLIDKCEKEWFNFGHNERKIQARVTFLKGYMSKWRFYQFDTGWARVNTRFPKLFLPLRHAFADDGVVAITLFAMLQDRVTNDRHFSRL